MEEIENKIMNDLSLDDIFDTDVFENDNDEPLWDKLIQHIRKIEHRFSSLHLHIKPQIIDGNN